MSRMVYAVLIGAVFVCGAALGNTEAERHRARGIELGAEGDFAAAKQELQKTLEIDPTWVHVRRLIELADAVLENRHSEAAATLYFQAVAYYDAGQTINALAWLAAVIEINSDYFLTYVFRGIIYGDTGDTLSALADFDRAIALNPDAFEPYFMRGEMHYFSGRGADALPDLEQSIALNPNFAPAYSNLGNIYADQGSHDDAVAQFSKAIDLDPVWAPSYFDRGNSYSALWKYRLALHDYDKAIELDPWFFEAYIGRGLVHIERGNFYEALADFDSALAINSDEPISIYNKAIAYSLLHQDEAAVGAYRKFVKVALPRYPDEVGIAKEAIAELEIAAVWFRYWLFYGGVGFHNGSIGKIDDEYHTPSTPANDIYKTSPQLGLVLGARRGMLMAELSLEGGLLRLTDSAQAAIDSVYGDEYKVSSGFISAEVTLGSTYRVRLYPFRQYLRIYGAVSGGLLIQTLFFEDEEDEIDPEFDVGFGAALKAGLDYAVLKDRSVFVRLGTRYQVLAELVGVPRTFTVFLGVGIRL